MIDANAPNAPRKVSAAEKRRKAVEYRIGGLSLEQIGEKLGVSKQAVHRMLTVAMAQSAKLETETATELRSRENARLDQQQAAIWGAVLKGDIGAGNLALRIEQRRAALNGLDMQTDVSKFSDALLLRILGLAATHGADGQAEQAQAPGANE